MYITVQYIHKSRWKSAWCQQCKSDIQYAWPFGNFFHIFGQGHLARLMNILNILGNPFVDHIELHDPAWRVCPWISGLKSMQVTCTVKSSNFVILFGEKIFFLQTLFWLHHNFFRYWSLYGTGLGSDQSHFGLGQCLGLTISFFLGWRN